MERKAVVLAMLVIMTIIMSARASSPVSTPSSFQFVMGTDYYAPTDILMPQKGTTFNDPDFHTTIVRVTDKADGYSGPGIENEYARTDPENSDGTYVILRGNDACMRFLGKQQFLTSLAYGHLNSSLTLQFSIN